MADTGPGVGDGYTKSSSSEVLLVSVRGLECSSSTCSESVAWIDEIDEILSTTESMAWCKLQLSSGRAQRANEAQKFEYLCLIGKCIPLGRLEGMNDGSP